MDIASVSSARNFVGWSFAAKSSTTYTVSFWIESLSGVTGVVSYVTGTLGTGGSTNIITAPTATGRVQYTFTTGTGAGSVDVRLGIGASGNANGSIRISGFQVNEGSTALAYQPIAATWRATMPGNHATAPSDPARPDFQQDINGLLHLAFNGSSQSISTSAIDFTGTDKMSVFAGVTKLDDSVLRFVAELSVNASLNNGTFWLAAPRQAAADYAYRSSGTLSSEVISAASYPAPDTSVLTGISDIGADIVRLRRNGVQIGSASSDQGTGNYGNYPLFIGSRNNAGSRLNGRLYGLIVRGAESSVAQITATERWMAGKTGVTI
jgi:hypothetical protein